MTRRETVVLIAAWAAAVLGSTAIVPFAIPSLRDHVWAMFPVVVLAVPLARLLACPLALAWNRHR